MSVGYDAALSEAVVPPAHVVWLQRAVPGASRVRPRGRRPIAVMQALGLAPAAG